MAFHAQNKRPKVTVIPVVDFDIKLETHTTK